MSQLEKVGPQGDVPPIKELLPEIQESFGVKAIPRLFSDPLWKEAKQDALKYIVDEIGPGYVKPLTPEEVVDKMRSERKLATNSGIPDFTRRNRVIDRALEFARLGT